MLKIAFFIYGVAVIYLSLCSVESKIRIVPEETEIYTPCQNKPGTLFLTDVFDLSETNLEFKDDNIQVSGDTKVTWDIAETDRVEVNNVKRSGKKVSHLSHIFFGCIHPFSRCTVNYSSFNVAPGNRLSSLPPRRISARIFWIQRVYTSRPGWLTSRRPIVNASVKG